MGAVPRRSSEFEALFDGVWDQAVDVARRIVGTSDAEDVAVEAFARALERWDRVRRSGNPDAWVLRVTINVGLDRLRRRRRRPPLDIATPVSPQEAIALRFTVREALARLPRRQAQVLALRYLAHLSEPEVAEILGLSLGSIKTHNRRGLTALRRRLGPSMEEFVDAR